MNDESDHGHCAANRLARRNCDGDCSPVMEGRLFLVLAPVLSWSPDDRLRAFGLVRVDETEVEAIRKVAEGGWEQALGHLRALCKTKGGEAWIAKLDDNRGELVAEVSTPMEAIRHPMNSRDRRSTPGLRVWCVHGGVDRTRQSHRRLDGASDDAAGGLRGLLRDLQKRGRGEVQVTVRRVCERSLGELPVVIERAVSRDEGPRRAPASPHPRSGDPCRLRCRIRRSAQRRGAAAARGGGYMGRRRGSECGRSVLAPAGGRVLTVTDCWRYEASSFASSRGGSGIPAVAGGICAEYRQ